MTMVSAEGENSRSLIGAGRMGSLERTKNTTHGPLQLCLLLIM